jgi:hypothetical protein
MKAMLVIGGNSSIVGMLDCSPHCIARRLPNLLGASMNFEVDWGREVVWTHGQDHSGDTAQKRCTNQENAVLTVSCQGGIFHSFQCYVCCFSRMAILKTKFVMYRFWVGKLYGAIWGLVLYGACF